MVITYVKFSFTPSKPSADWIHKFYAPGTPIWLMENTIEVTPQTMGFFQQEYKWFTHHPEDMYDDFIQPDIHVNPATVGMG